MSDRRAVRCDRLYVSARRQSRQSFTCKRVLGRKAVLRQSHFDSPKSHAPRRNISPRVAAKNKWRRIEALQRNKQWLADYQAAMRKYNAGDHDAVFPYGTYRMQHQAHVPIDVTAYLATRIAAAAT